MRRSLRAAAAMLVALPIANGEPPSAVDAVASALAVGMRNADPHVRAHAAQRLRTLGATPAAGEEDVATRWLAAAPHQPIAPFRDRVLGPAYRKLSLAPNGTARFDQTFFAGQTARIRVIGPKPAQIDLSVADNDGSPQCGSAARLACTWVPLWTTHFRVEIRNRGAAPAALFVVVQ